MPVFEFTRWSGRIQTVAADEVTFPAGALVFRSRDRIVLAVKPGDWNDLRDVDAAADQHARPDEVVHLVRDDGRTATDCCQRTPQDLPHAAGHRMTADPRAVTCPAAGTEG